MLFKPGEYLDYGTFSKVYDALPPKDFPIKTPIVLKIYSSSTDKNVMTNEKNVYKYFKTLEENEYIVKCFEIISKPTLTLALEKMEGDLWKYHCDGLYGDERSLINAFHSISKGLYFMHKNALSHGDVSFSNIMYKMSLWEYEFKWIDFGFTSADPDFNLDIQAPIKFQGTPIYIPPEYIEGKPPIGIIAQQKKDLWGLGMIFHFLATGRFPFDLLNDLFFDSKEDIDTESMKLILMSTPKFRSLHAGFTHVSFFEGLFKGLLEVDPSKRWSSIHLISYFEKYQKDEIGKWS